MNWFETLFGFTEGPYHWTQRQFIFGNGTLISRPNRRRLIVGKFTTPTLSDLRRLVRPQNRRHRLRHEVIDDILPLHAAPENAHATFQVASQFNCLEFPSPQVTPLDGVTRYANDPTQGPACSLAAAGATVVRNYFANVDGQQGQNDKHQINTLSALERLLPGGPFWTIRNGYTFSTSSQLQQLAAVLESSDRQKLMGQVQIGWHQGAEVTFSDRFVIPSSTQLISQTFCSAVSCAYTDIPTTAWRPLASLVLEAAYEATLLAAAIERDAGSGSGTVWLTMLGGGVFRNDDDWIYEALKRALDRTHYLGLDIRLAHHRELRQPYTTLR